MSVQLFTVPRPPLDRFVAGLWLVEGYHTPNARERLLPTGTVELVVNLGEDRMRIYDGEDVARTTLLDGAVVCGAHSRSFVIDAEEQQRVVGVHFRPGGAYPFLGARVDEVENLHLSLEDLWGARARALRERLGAEADPRARLRLLESALLERAFRPLEQHPAVARSLAMLHGAPRLPTVAEITREIGLSARRVAQLFREQVGLTPKRYCRVVRFQRVIEAVRPLAEVRWAEAAIDCGYSDQAHLARDFRELSGLTPTEYLRQRTDHLNHVPLPPS
ncbi:MAG TPA: helix-turn-helix domain-containing protein [Thermoanaerobaculia bacterium]|nr:helix-turn-helix domain-containing protein [Thermoanaerobaculia bacterium]